MTDTLAFTSPSQTERRIATVLIAWMAAVAAAAGFGILAEVPLPLFGGLATMGMVLPTVTYFALPALRRWAEGVGIRALTLLHAWRIPAALVFFEHGSAGLLPADFMLAVGTGLLLSLMAAPRTSSPSTCCVAASSFNPETPRRFL